MENNYAIGILETQLKSLKDCLDRKDWASSNYEYDILIRKRYVLQSNQLESAINILKANK